MPTDYDELFKRAGQTPSPGGLDLNALLQRSIAGNIAGAQEETGIRRRKDASDLLTAELQRAAIELENRMQGYEFSQTQDFDKALSGDPRLAATLTNLFQQQGVNPLTAPTSRRALQAFHQFTPGVASHNEIAAGILRNWQALSDLSPGQPEPPEVSWARNVLRIPTTSGAGTNANASGGGGGGSSDKGPSIPFGKSRSFVEGFVPRAAGTAGAVGTYKGLGKLIPTGTIAEGATGLSKFGQMASKVGRVGLKGGLGALVGFGLEDVLDEVARETDPEYDALAKRYPGYHRLGQVAGSLVPFAFGREQLKQNLKSTAESEAKQQTMALARRTTEGQGRARLTATESMLPAEAAKVPGTVMAGGPQLREYAERFKKFYGKFPSSRELEDFVRGNTRNLPPLRTLPAPRPGPYKPKVKGYEEHLQRYFGQ